MHEQVALKIDQISEKKGATHYCFPRAGRTRFLIPIYMSKVEFFSLINLSVRSCIKALIYEVFQCLQMKRPQYKTLNNSQSSLLEVINTPFTDIAVIYGTKGPNSKDTLLLMDRGELEVLRSVVKISNSPNALLLIKNESIQLETLSKLDGDLAIPALLQEGTIAGYGYLEQSALNLKTSVADTSQKLIEHQLLQFLCSLRRVTEIRKPLRESTWFKNLSAKLHLLEKDLPSNWKKRIQAVLVLLHENISVFRFSYAHRDFVQWNMGLSETGQLYVFDWEYAVEECLPLYDYFHYYLMPSALKGKLKSKDLKQLLITHRSQINVISSEQVSLQLLAYLLDLSMIYIESRENKLEEGLVDSQYGVLIDNYLDWYCE